MSAVTVGLCQFRPTKGAPAANLDRIEETFRTVAAQPSPPGVLIFPEAILTGYFLEGGVREHALTAADLFDELARRHARSNAPPVEVCVGFYELFDDRLHNSALWAALGGTDAGIRHVHRKVFLPTYGVFDEERFVEAGRDVRAFPTRFGRAAMLVCEDAWHSLTATIAAVDGAELVAIVAASPARGLAPDPLHPGEPGSLARWERLARDIASEHGVYVALVQLVGFEGGKGFPGGSILADPSGEVIARAPLFEDALTVRSIDTDELVRVRAKAPLLADLEMRLPHLIDALQARRRERAGEAPEPAQALAPARTPLAPLPAPRPDLRIDPGLTRQWLVEFLRDEVRRRRGFDDVVVAVSGGVDSAVVAYLAAEAFGAGHVVAMRLPYRTSSKASLDDAQLVVDALGVQSVTVDISEAVDGFASASGIDPTPARLGNVMARLRMVALFDRSAACNALPLGTGNKSERLLGYFTWHADDAPPVNPIGDLYKTQVWALARHLGVPQQVIDKPATADLVANQTDEADFGVSYANADPILELLITGYPDASIVAAGFDAGDVARVRTRLDGTHWKRRLPSVAMVSNTAIGEYYLRPVDY
jgi:NAD+ synthase (glutamine-hydrolysing)